MEQTDLCSFGHPCVEETLQLESLTSAFLPGQMCSTMASNAARFSSRSMTPSPMPKITHDLQVSDTRFTV